MKEATSAAAKERQKEGLAKRWDRFPSREGNQETPTTDHSGETAHTLALAGGSPIRTPEEAE
jgi:hypothetical protein